LFRDRQNQGRENGCEWVEVGRQAGPGERAEPGKENGRRWAEVGRQAGRQNRGRENSRRWAEGCSVRRTVTGVYSLQDG